jgi:hypothetical protein
MTKTQTATKIRIEAAQRSADAYIELAQLLEAQAKRLRANARGYRSGELLAHYGDNLPAGCAPEMAHPAQRAIDGLSCYDIREAVERLRAELKS